MTARRRLLPLAVSVCGVLAGHWLTYLVVAPAAGARTAILHETGHAYLGMANDLALVLALSALATMFIAQLTGRPPEQLRGLTGRVVRFQVGAFVLLEVLERITAGSPVGELIRAGVLPVGVAVQVGVGVVAARAIRWLFRTADRVAAALARAAVPARRAASPSPVREPVFIPAERHLSAAGVRGPPSLA